MSDTEPNVCFICGHTASHVLEEHHAVPQRLGGSDADENTYYLCGSCHNALEEIYDDDFYRRLGIAVDDVADNRFTEKDMGVSLDAEQSPDRKIAFKSPHVIFEEWVHEVHVSDVKDAQNGDYDGEYADALQQYADDILTEYREKIGGTSDGNIPQVRFYYHHDSLVTIPFIHIWNPFENKIDYEDYPAEMSQQRREDVRGALEARAQQNIDNQSDTDSVREHYKKQPRFEWQEDSPYPERYRIHCSYCNTAFSQFQHGGMARHLRTHHGVENPYEVRDSAFGEPPEGSSIGKIFGDNDD